MTYALDFEILAKFLSTFSLALDFYLIIIIYVLNGDFGS